VQNQEQEPLVLKLSGEMTIRTITDAWRNLQDAFQASDNIIVDLSDIGTTDMSFIQLLLSAQKTAEARNKAFHLSAPVKGDFRQDLERGGFLEPPSGTRTFWLNDTGDSHG